MIKEIKLIRDNDQLVEQVKIDLSDSDNKLLEDYYQASEKLMSLSIFKKEIPLGLDIRVKKSMKGVCSLKSPTEDDIAAVLHKLRFFILQNEPFSFYKTAKLLKERSKNKKIIKIIKAISSIFEGRSLQKQIRVSINGEVINHEKMFQNWLNAYEYHNDLKKKQKIDKLHKVFPLEISQNLFLMMLMDKIKAIVELQQIVGVLINKKKETKVLSRN